MTWVPIVYWDYWDFPRFFVVQWRERTYSFDCPWDEVKDDYSDFFQVRELPPEVLRELASASWDDLVNQGRLVGRVPVTKVRLRRMDSHPTVQTRKTNGKVIGGAPGAEVDDEDFETFIDSMW